MGLINSLPCRHILCNSCLRQLDPRKCPHCREGFDIDDVEEVGFTATEQWDKLLQVATQATALPSVGEGDSGSDHDEGQEERRFITESSGAERYLYIYRFPLHPLDLSLGK